MFRARGWFSVEIDVIVNGSMSILFCPVDCNGQFYFALFIALIKSGERFRERAGDYDDPESEEEDLAEKRKER